MEIENSKINILDWLLKNKEFIFLRFFTTVELQNNCLISKIWNEKVTAILLWRQMMSGIACALKPIQPTIPCETLKIELEPQQSAFSSSHASKTQKKIDKNVTKTNIVNKPKKRKVLLAPEKEKPIKLTEKAEKSQSKPIEKERKTHEDKKAEKKQEISTQIEKREELKGPKFSRRFQIMKGGSGVTQWIQKPELNFEQSIEELLKVLIKYPHKRQSTFHTFSQWHAAITNLISTLQKTVPENNLLAEIYYWRDSANVLSALHSELKLEFVAIVEELMLENSSKEERTLINQFKAEKTRIIKATKEAEYNYKYLKIIEKPIKTIYHGSLLEISIIIVPLMNSLRNIYQVSKFYKESRIVSFTEKIVKQIRKQINEKLPLIKTQKELLIKGKEFSEQIDETLSLSKDLLTKLNNNLFIRELESTVSEKMTSFSSKPLSSNNPTNMDFLSFQRPDTGIVHENMLRTSYGGFYPPPSSSRATTAASRESSRIHKFNPQIQKPKNQQMWFEKVQIIDAQIQYLIEVVDNFSFLSDSMLKIKRQSQRVEKHIQNITPQSESGSGKEILSKIKGKGKQLGKSVGIAQSIKLKNQIDNFLKMYTEDPLDYDAFHLENKPLFTLFMDNFEKNEKRLQECYEEVMVRKENKIEFFHVQKLSEGERQNPLRKDSFSSMENKHMGQDEEDDDTIITPIWNIK